MTTKPIKNYEEQRKFYYIEREKKLKKNIVLGLVKERGTVSKEEINEYLNKGNQPEDIKDYINNLNRNLRSYLDDGTLKRFKVGLKVYYTEGNNSTETLSLIMNDTDQIIESIPPLKEFVKVRIDEERRSKASVKMYAWKIIDFYKFLGLDNTNGARPIETITREDIKAYNDYLRETRKVSQVTRANILAILSAYFNFCDEREYIKTNPMDHIKRLIAPQHKNAETRGLYFFLGTNDNRDLEIYSRPMKETLCVHWILAKIYSIGFINQYISPRKTYHWAEKLTLSPRDFFNYAYLRENMRYDTFKIKNYRQLYLYYREINEQIAGYIWFGKARNFLFGEMPDINEFLAALEKKQRPDWTLLDSIYADFQAYQWLSTNSLGHITISKDQERLKATEDIIMNHKQSQDSKARHNSNPFAAYYT